MRGKYWALVAGGLLVSVAVWIGVHQISSSDSPPRWTMKDLPASIPASQNGFMLFASLPKNAGSTPDSMRPLLKSPSWSEAQRQSELIEEVLTQEESTLALLHRALQAPHFADGCGIRIEDPCYAGSLIRVFALARLESLRLAMRGQWSDSFALQERSIAANQELLLTSKHIVVSKIALVHLRHSLDLLAVLLAQHAGPESTRTVLNAIDPSVFSLRSPIIAEHLRLQLVLETFPEGSSLWERLLLDHENTLAHSQEYTEGLLLFAQAPSTNSLPKQPFVPPHGWFWWLYNPTGKLMLGALSFDGVALIEGFDADLSSLRQQRDALLRTWAPATSPI
jgi:hypothetical protein